MLYLMKLKGILIWYIFVIPFLRIHKKEHTKKIIKNILLHIQSLTLLLNSELMVTVSLSLVLSNQERERGFSTSRNMFYSTWDFLSSSLCLLHNFQLPFFSLANSRFYIFLHWVTCPWKLNSFCFKSKSGLPDQVMP